MKGDSKKIKALESLNKQFYRGLIEGEVDIQELKKEIEELKELLKIEKRISTHYHKLLKENK
jgi:GTP1/Obg family GTP-binding protein